MDCTMWQQGPLMDVSGLFDWRRTMDMILMSAVSLVFGAVLGVLAVGLINEKGDA